VPATREQVWDPTLIDRSSILPAASHRLGLLNLASFFHAAKQLLLRPSLSCRQRGRRSTSLWPLLSSIAPPAPVARACSNLARCGSPKSPIAAPSTKQSHFSLFSSFIACIAFPILHHQHRHCNRQQLLRRAHTEPPSPLIHTLTLSHPLPPSPTMALRIPKTPWITIFHNPSLQTSKEALKLLQKLSISKKFKIDLIQDKKNPPTRPQIEKMVHLLAPGDIPKGCKLILIEDAPKATTVEEVQTILEKTPWFLKKPLVVDWINGKAVVAEVSLVSFIVVCVFSRWISHL